MKLLLLIFAICVAAHAVPITDVQQSIEGWYVPQADGRLAWFSVQQAGLLLSKYRKLEALSILSNNVKFYLFTKKNAKLAQELKQTKSSVDVSNFNPAYPTKFVIHGWTCDYLDESNLVVRDAWLKKGEFNIISVDWERARSKDYVSSVVAIPGAGEKVAAMLDFLRTTYGISLEKFEVIGHSLGAHVAGYTGKNVQNGKVPVIVGLDPALPLFSYNKPNDRLASTDAVYVESIQTNGGKLGFLQPIGVASFYPNGGKYQPGCGDDLDGLCSHRRSFTYYAEAVERNDFPTYACANYNDAVAKSCGSKFSTIRMSQPINVQNARGEYYVPIRNQAPWGYDGI